MKLKFFLGIGCVAALAGCATSMEMPTLALASTGGAIGQLKYAPSAEPDSESVIGDVVYSRGRNGESAYTFAKGGMTMVRVQQDGGTSYIDGALARSGWSGPVANAPSKVRPWFDLPEALDWTKRDEQTAPVATANWNVIRTSARAWRFEHKGQGAVFEFRN
jgi:hypothetical protein